MIDNGYIVWGIYDSEKLLATVTFRMMPVEFTEDLEESNDSSDNRIIPVFFK